MSNNPIRYSTACQATGSATNPVATLNPNQTFPVNFTGVADPTTNNPSTFTVGGWIRKQSSTAVGTIFLVNGQVRISIQNTGQLVMIVGNADLESDVFITDLNWHYVAVTYLPSSQPAIATDTGFMTIYLDGLEVGSGTAGVVPNQVSPGCYLAPNGTQIEFASWSIWSEALPSDVIGTPQWGDPTNGTTAADGLVAAYDFANGPGKDLSGNGYQVSVGAQLWHTPSMMVNSGGGSANIPTTSVNPGGGTGTPAAFSILGWIYIPSSPSLQANAVYPIFTNGPLTLRLTTDANSALYAGFAWPTAANVYQTPVSTGEWVHWAVTWNGTNTATFYLNGVQAGVLPLTPTAISTPAPALGGSNSAAGAYYIQGVSIWSKCLSLGDVDQYMLGADPTTHTGCVANFALLTDLGDSVNGNKLTVVNNSCQITELLTPMTAADAVAAEEPRLLHHHDLKAIAKKNGIDVDTPVSEADMAGPEYAEIGNWFDGLTSNLPPQGAARLKNEFLRNARIGLELRQKGIKAGSFSMAVEGGDTVGYYHTEAGPQEVYRLTGTVLTSTQQWAMTIIFDVITLIASMFGIVSTAAKVTKAAGILEPEISQLVGAIQRAYSITDSALMKAQKVSIVILGTMYSGNLLYTVVKEIVTGSWWSLAFTITNTVLMLIGLVVGGPTLIAIRVVQMGVHLAQLVYDLQQMPTSTPAPAEVAAAAS